MTRGATLVEIVVGMLVIGIVATGVMTTFVFGRQVTWRSHTELSATRFVEEIAETLRSAVDGDIPAGQSFAGLTLTPGIYVNLEMKNPPAGSSILGALNMPQEFRRFLSSDGTAPNMAGHGDGRLMVVEDLADLDGDGLTGLDLDNDGQADLRRVRVRVKFTSPSA